MQELTTSFESTTKGKDVGNYHEIVEHIGHFPNKVVGEYRAEEDENNGKQRIDKVGFLAEEVMNVYSAEKVQPRMVEKAKKSRQTATKALPSPLPKTEPKASWAALVFETPVAARDSAVRTVL